MPLIYVLLQSPRTTVVLQNFTYHAELLPHTEQIVFHKASFFGTVRRIYVDIKNLEKVEASTVASKYSSQYPLILFCLQ
jgi:glycyl-tRNA synthetase beta subunit